MVFSKKELDWEKKEISEVDDGVVIETHQILLDAQIKPIGISSCEICVASSGSFFESGGNYTSGMLEISRIRVILSNKTFSKYRNIDDLKVAEDSVLVDEVTNNIFTISLDAKMSNHKIVWKNFFFIQICSKTFS